jgi:hypothetical protein
MRNREPEPVLGVDVHLDRPRGPVPSESMAAVRAVSASAALLCAVLLACLVAASASAAAPSLEWRTTEKIDSTPLTGVSCASVSLCVAVDESGNALLSTNPAADSASTWHEAGIPGAGALTGVSCPSSSLCVAVDAEGHAAISTNPVVGGSTWHTAKISDAALTGVSCASDSLCVAVDASGNVFVSSNPGEGAGGSASWREISTGHALTAVSCVAGPLCVAVDKAGEVLESSEPASSWVTRQIDNSPLLAVSCASAPAGVCVAVDEAGVALASGNPSAGLPSTSTATWSATPLTLGASSAPAAASCAAAGLCVLGAGKGDAYIGDSPAAAAPSWTFAPIDSSAALAGVSCVSEGLCAAVDNAGRVLVTRVPAPAVVIGTPSAVGETTATVTGTVDTNDATLASCRFEYGTSEAYGQSAPCGAGGTQVLAAGSANQPISAALSGLAANVTYDYRLTAVSASGEARTANATFKTTSPPLVQPHPSIGGIPAPGQRLTCKSGVSGSGASSATLSYAWLRDTRAIAGASGSTYVVASADVTHHLQCRVTATNAGGSANGTSSFVTVPAGGLGAISETQVGTPRVAGRTVSVSLTCSAQAAGSCTIVLRLTVVETLRGSRVIAVAARRAARLARVTAARRTSHKTVTVGAVTVHVPAGQRRTVTVALNTTGRRLLASQHKLTAKLSVSGTVVGALSAQLRSATVTLGGTGKASSRKASTHRRR